MPPVSVMIKPSSGNCNLRCKYCFYYDTMSKRQQGSYGFMTEETLEQVIKKVLAHASGRCTIAYQGGEPTLRGVPFFEKSLEFQKKYNVNHVKIFNALQTNGYAIDDQWADFFKEHQFLVGVSLDGGPKIHDYYRKTPHGEGSFFKIMKNIELLKKKGVDFNILSVVNARTAPQIKHNYRFYQKNQLDYLQFIACLDPLGEEPGSREYSLTPELYGKFLIELFDLWYQDLLEGKQPYIRQFENYLGILLGNRPESCDMCGVCSRQYVVEADGSVYPCDFYVLDEYRLGNLNSDTMEEIDQAREQIGFISESEKRDESCLNCRYEPLCRSGCRRTRMADKNHSQYFCKAYQMLFDHCLPQMIQIADRMSGGSGNGF